MDQRRDPRFVVDQPVFVTVLGDSERLHKGRIRNESGRGLLIEVIHEVPMRTALRIDVNNSILLGEVVYCQGGNGLFLLGVKLDQVLCGLAELDMQLLEFAPDIRVEARLDNTGGVLTMPG